MFTRLVAAGALCLCVAHAANATVYFNSVAASNPFTSGGDGPVADSVTMASDSFTAGTPNFSQLSLVLSNTGGTAIGSVMVYLVPDNNSGAGVGFAGNPEPVVDGIQLGTVRATTLSTSPSLVTINFSPLIDAALADSNQEYWITLVFTTGSSIQWYYGADGSGIGETNQINTDIFFTEPDSNGAYDMIVSTPEPASLAILGGGLAGLGYLRRRKMSRA